MKRLLYSSILLIGMLSTNANAQNMAPDGSYVSGDSNNMAPDGSYIGN